MIRVVLVDDHNLIRTGFRTILETEPDIEVVGEAADGAAAVTLVAELEPDVVCMDVQMPVMDGISATREIASAHGSSSVLILTTFNREDFLFEALSAGAAGFLLKTAETEELIHAIRALSNGDALLSPQVTRRVIERFTRHQAVPRNDELLATLTKREQEVLLLVARGLNNTEIAGELYVSTETVKTHVSKVLDKIQARDRIQAVIWAYEQGLVTPGQ